MKRFVVLLACSLALVSCGEEPLGPPVVGMMLPDAQAKLTAAGITSSAHAPDALMGILIPGNFVVCSVENINDTAVRLEVSKSGC